MDDAFISRITVPIKYPSLNKVSQKEIWERFCNRYEVDEDNARIRVDSEARDYVCSYEKDLNGREIRTGMSVAAEEVQSINVTLQSCRMLWRLLGLTLNGKRKTCRGGTPPLSKVP